MNGTGSAGDLLLDLTRDVTGTLDLQEVLDRSFAALRRLVRFGGGAIQLVDRGALVAAATDPQASPEARTVRIPIGTGVSGGIAASGVPVYIPDITIDPRVHPDGRAKGVSGGVRSYYGLPLIARGESIGVLQVDAPLIDAFSEADRATMLAFAPAVASAVQNAQTHAHQIAAAEERAETHRLKNDFIAIVSHELRTPLTSITGFAESLNRHGGQMDADAIVHLSGRILAGADRLKRHLDDLMMLAGLEHGRLRVDLAETRVEPAVRLGCAEATDQAHRMRLWFQPDLPSARTDPDRLRQIVAALVSNACKFSPTGTEIIVRVEQREGAILVSVRDRGPGIPEGRLEQVFDRFVQVEPADRRTSDGLGIGLYLARLLCDGLDASIDVKSTMGEGSVFTLRLPVSSVAVPAGRATTT